MQVEINHPNAKAIAAFFNGRRIRWQSETAGGGWINKDTHPMPNLTRDATWEIEPEVVVKYSAGTIVPRVGVVFQAQEFTDAKSAINITVCCVLKKTYTDGVLTAVELVEINNV